MDISTTNFQRLKLPELTAIKDHIINNTCFTCYAKEGKEIGYCIRISTTNMLIELSELISRIDYLQKSGLATPDNPIQMEDLALYQYKFYMVLEDNGMSKEEIINIINEFYENE
jgi:hypothetical protein